jgi:6-pyruvoyltetrahydropterin/6-carboxytetrahydropterin synthase
MKLSNLQFYRAKDLSFSAGHFTIFSATQRERLHGHNYQLEASITAPLGEPGITFDYAIFRNKLAALCRQIHSRLLLPALSPYLRIETEAEHYRVFFDNQYMLFLKEDVMIMPLTNITIEELSHWFINQLTSEKDFIRDFHIQEITVKIYNGPEHSANCQWQLSQSA